MVQDVKRRVIEASKLALKYRREFRNNDESSSSDDDDDDASGGGGGGGGGKKKKGGIHPLNTQLVIGERGGVAECRQRLQINEDKNTHLTTQWNAFKIPGHWAEFVVVV